MENQDAGCGAADVDGLKERFNVKIVTSREPRILVCGSTTRPCSYNFKFFIHGRFRTAFFLHIYIEHVGKWGPECEKYYVNKEKHKLSTKVGNWV